MLLSALPLVSAAAVLVVVAVVLVLALVSALAAASRHQGNAENALLAAAPCYRGHGCAGPGWPPIDGWSSPRNRAVTSKVTLRAAEVETMVYGFYGRDEQPSFR